MARCGCSGGTCSCIIRGAGTTQVTGAGTISSPYVIDSRLYVVSGTEGTANTAITGSGSAGDPYVFNVSQDVYLNDIQDVVASGGSTGDVLAKQADGSFALVPPVTAPVGAISTDSTLDGDGSSGDVLGVNVQSGGGLEATPTGLAVAGFTSWSDYTPVITTSQGQTITLDSGSTIDGRYLRMGNLVFINIMFNASLNIPVSTGKYSFSLPIPDAHSVNSPGLLNAFAYTSTTQPGHAVGTAFVEGSNTVARTRLWNGSYFRDIDSRWPQWGSYAHRIVIHGFYEAA